MGGCATERRHPIRIEGAPVPPAFLPALLPALAATCLVAILPACRLGRPNVPRPGAIEVSTLGDSGLANRIATSPEPQPEALRDLFRNAIWPLWGFLEYLDIVESARALNASLPAGAEKLRVIGLGNSIDLHDVLCGPWWSKGDDLWKMARNDAFMAGVLEREVLDRGAKALVQIGSMHSFPRYRQPIVSKGTLAREAGPRMGHLLHDAHGDRVFQILLHQWHFGPEMATAEDATPRQPFGGFLERVFAARDNAPAGFDIEGSPFAMLRDETSDDFAFQRYAIFSDLAQGYVFLRPLEDLHRVRWVEGFIDVEHFARARDIARAKGWITEDEGRTPRELNERMKDVVENEQRGERDLTSSRAASRWPVGCPGARRSRPQAPGVPSGPAGRGGRRRRGRRGERTRRLR